jgi:PAS domain S-box-containing protein
MFSFKSVIFKLIAYVVLSYAVAAGAVLLIADHRIKTVIDNDQRLLYTERLQAIINILNYYEHRLDAGGRKKSYTADFQKEALETLATTYFLQPDLPTYPVVLDGLGKVLLHPQHATLPEGLRDNTIIHRILAKKSGRFNFTDKKGDRQWLIFRYFKKWDWIAVYVVPFTLKYAEARRLTDSLALIMAVTVVVVATILVLVIGRMIRPVTQLNRAARAFADGRSNYPVTLTGSDEFGTLAASFLRMREAINEKIDELGAKNKALSESMEKFQALVAGSPFGVAQIDPQGRYQYINPQFTRMFGYTLADVPSGREWFEKAFPDPAYRREAVSTWRDDLLQSRVGEMRPRIFDVTCSDGSRKIIRFRPVIQSSGNHFVIYEDITGQRLLEMQLRQGQKLESIGTLAGGISHDFNNILSAVIGYTELCLLDAPEGSTLYRHLQSILEAGARARDLVKQILAFSRQNKQELRPVDLSVIVKETAKLLRATLPTTIEIHQYIDTDALVMGDPTQMHQVLMNLCTNAGHAMQEKGGILEIRLENTTLDADISSRHAGLKPGPFVCLTVSDSGRGMPLHVLERIFDPFFTTKEKTEGTGMGLSVAHGIVTAAGGTIHAYSEVSHGASFKVLLPMIERRLEPEPRPDAIIVGGNERILFVDDEKTLVDMGRQMLQSYGYEVTTSTDSLEALNLFRSDPSRFDLVITDMTMPHMTGDALAKALMERRPDLPVILCTGFSASMTDKAAAELGIRALVMKPILMHQIAATVRRVLDESKAHDAQED